MSRASDLANLIASGNTTIFGEAGAPTVNAGQSNQTGGTTNLQQGLTKVWINFNDGSEADAVQDSFNVTTLTDRGSGLWTLTVTNNFANTNYEGSGSAADAWPDADARNRMVLNGPNSTSEIYINVFDTSGSTENDPDYVGASNHGDLA